MSGSSNGDSPNDAIPAGALDVCAFEDIGSGEAKRVDVNGHRLAVVRIEEDVYVSGDRCTHAEASLAEGEVDAETLHIECWRHGSSFSLVTGQPDVPPATKATPVYDARVDNGRVLVVLSDDAKEGSRG
jgi:3-phenylpropionate/trans-cinnamate dioxygenase ferredoxin subunit